ncbi:MAG: caspase family protein [bacterium]|nr:caspase family protein [bacterium]
MKQLLPILIALFIVFQGLPAAAKDRGVPPESKDIRRFSLVVGANNGGRSRARLRYAVSDAKAVLSILEKMGGISPDDSRLLVEPNKETLYWELERLQGRVQRAKKKARRVEVFFYYSGHSDESHFLLAKEKVPYREFKDKINIIGADVRIAILDSCASGAFTRIKGGKKKTAFMVDTAFDMKGYAIMTSSSSNESSQESDRLKGSFFTNSLVSGLRGAADVSGDGRVTLNEAYQFAFAETLAQTEKTVSGPQHPNYNIRMSGTGDVVITDLRKSEALLRIGKNVGGKLFIHSHTNVLVAELSKPAGRVIELGLDEGKYRVINIIDNTVYESKITLKKDRKAELTNEHFKKTEKIDTVARGDLKVLKRKKVLLTGKGKIRLFATALNKLVTVNKSWQVISGGYFGITFNRSLSVGFAAYGGSDKPEGMSAYAGILMEYDFNPFSRFHVKVGGLLGYGNGDTYVPSSIYDWTHSRAFFIFEPEVTLLLNVSRFIRIGAGVSIPISEKASGLGNIGFGLRFEFGK